MSISVKSSSKTRPTGDAIASELLRHHDEQGDDWADIIDMLTMDPEARRKVTRLMAEIERLRLTY